MRHAGVSGDGRRHTGMADHDREAQKGAQGRDRVGSRCAALEEVIQAQEA